jgi:hypothetical protein
MDSPTALGTFAIMAGGQPRPTGHRTPSLPGCHRRGEAVHPVLHEPGASIPTNHPGNVSVD